MYLQLEMNLQNNLKLVSIFNCHSLPLDVLVFVDLVTLFIIKSQGLRMWIHFLTVFTILYFFVLIEASLRPGDFIDLFFYF